MQATTLVDPAALAPVDGRVDLAPLQEAAPAIVAADESVQLTAGQLDELDTSALLAARRRAGRDPAAPRSPTSP